MSNHRVEGESPRGLSSTWKSIVPSSPAHVGMEELIANFDWAQTNIGPREQWPSILRSMVNIALRSGFPMLIFWGPDLVQIYNDAYIPLFGARHPQGLGQPAHLCWPEVWDTVGPLLHRTMHTGEPVWGEDMLFQLERNGYTEKAYFTFSYSQIKGDREDELGVLCTNIETTKTVLRESEFRTTADTLANIIFTHAPDGNIEWANARWFEYTQLPSTVALTAQGWKQLLPPEDAALLFEKLEYAFGRGEPYDVEARIKPYGAGTEQYRWHLIRAVPVRDENGTILRWAGSATDVHDRRTAVEARLRDIQSLADSVPQLIWTVDAEVRAETVNLQFVKFTGMSLESVREFGWQKLIPVEEHAGVFAAFTEGARTKQPISFNYHLLHGETQTFRAMLGRANPSLDAAGNVIGWVGTSTDIDQAHRESMQDRLANTAYQIASLPRALPQIAGLRFSADYHAGRTGAMVGGDWYDAFELQDGRVIVSIGDVIGSGLDSAVTMAAVRQAIRGAAQIHPDPGAVLDAVDRALSYEQPDRIVTAFLGVFDPVTSFFTYASAGHPPPLLRRPDGSIVELVASGLPLGLRADVSKETAKVDHVHLPTGCLLILYTDGLTEATRDTTVGERRLRAAASAAKLDNAEIANYIRKSVLESDPHDDIAVLTLTIERAPLFDNDDERFFWPIDPQNPNDVAATRRHVADLLHKRHAHPDRVYDAQIILGELIGNAVRHAAGAIEVAVDLRKRHPVLHVLDRGSGCSFVAGLPRDTMSESGRGLFIVAELARDFSITPRPDGGSHASAVLDIPAA